MSPSVNNVGMRVTDVYPANKKVETSVNFRDVLNLQFSKHANMRLNARNINLTGEQMERVENGVVKADEQGVRDSLVLVDDIALVVNVRSRTVITAIRQGKESEKVFSNIDGAVIV